MSDDDLIRDAVHELVAAAPPPKPLPMGGAPSGGSYRWLAVAAAVILVIGGIVAIAWSQADDDATPVATTQPPPLPTPPPTTVVTSTPGSTSPVTVTVPETTVPQTVESTSTTTSTSTTATTSTTVPPTPEQAQLQDYLEALAEGRYDVAALLLREGGLEYERRSDVRPLFTEFGNVTTANLSALLVSWCEDVTLCTAPDAPPVDIGGYWLATWTTDDGVLTGYFRSGSFEGSPSVSGLPPRLPSAPVVVCPANDVELVREADLDGDGAPEGLVVSRNNGLFVHACNTALSIPALELEPMDNVVAGILQPASDPAATLLIGESGESSVCGATYRMAASAGALIKVGWEGCWGANTGVSIGCRDVDGQSMIVDYRYSFVGGDRLDNSTAIDVDVLSLDGAPLDSFSLALPDQIEEAFQIIEPHCNGLPVMTEG